jgi:glucose-1-phosphate thymidylyltransferase
MTLITNKHLLPVYDKPMILYPLETLRRSGVEDIMIVCGREYGSHFMKFLGSGRDFGVRLSYALQDADDGGIADALRYAEHFVGGEDTAMILGDNIFDYNFNDSVGKFDSGTVVFLKKVSDPRRFAVPVFSKDGKRIELMEEKPNNPKSGFAHVGFYLFDPSVFDKIRLLVPSARGQYEIADVMNKYIKEGRAKHTFIKGFWSDAGTIESLHKSSAWAAREATKNMQL